MARIEGFIAAGWSPILAVASTSTSRVLEVVGWTGGFGTAPSTGLFIGSNGFVANITDGVNIAGGGGGGGGSINISAGTTSNNVTAVTFSNSNGVTFGYDGTVITASVKTDYQTSGNYLTTAAQSNQVVNSLNGSTGQISLNVGSSLSSSTNGSSITFGLASNITTALQSAGAYLTTADLSQNSSKYIQNWKLTGNTSGTTSSAQGTDLWLAGGNGLTISGSSNTLSFSVNTSYRASNDAVGLNTAQSNVTWTVNSSGISLDGRGYAGTGTTFNGANISGSITQNSNGLNLSLSANAPAAGSVNFSAGTTSSNITGVTFANSNGVSFGLNTGANTGVITATVATTYMQNWKLTGNTAGTTSSAQGPDFWLAGGNGVTLSGSSNTISFSVNTSYRASNDAVGLNTAQTNVTWTVNSSGISLNAAGYAGTGTTFNGANISGSITQNSNGINLSMSVAAPGGGGAVNFSAGTTSNNLQSVVFNNSNGVSFGLGTGASSQSITASVAATSLLSATGMVSISTTGSTISIGAAETPKSYYSFGNQLSNNTSTLGGSSVLVQPFILPYDLSASYLRIAGSFGINSTTFATSANTTMGITHTHTLFANIYTLGSGASSQSLQYITGSSGSIVFQATGQIGAASNNQTVGYSITYFSGGNTASSTATYNVNSSVINFSSTGLTAFNGLRWLDLPFAISLSGAAYWVGLQRSFSSSSSVTNLSGIFSSNITHFVATQINSNFALMGAASNGSTNPLQVGLGLWSTNANGSTSSSMGLASVSSQPSHVYMPFQLINQS